MHRQVSNNIPPVALLQFNKISHPMWPALTSTWKQCILFPTEGIPKTRCNTNLSSHLCTSENILWCKHPRGRGYSVRLSQPLRGFVSFALFVKSVESSLWVRHAAQAPHSPQHLEIFTNALPCGKIITQMEPLLYDRSSFFSNDAIKCIICTIIIQQVCNTACKWVDFIAALCEISNSATLAHYVIL